MTHKGKNYDMDANMQPINFNSKKKNKSAQDISIKARSNYATYYKITILYCTFLLISGLVIIFAPESWLFLPEVTTIMNEFAHKMPGLVNIVSISKTPQAYIFGYSVAFLTMPIHIIALTAIGILRFKSGHVTKGIIVDGMKWGWVIILITWIMFCTCLFCDNSPGRKALLVLSPIVVATLGQAWIAIISIYPSFIIIFLLDRYRVITQTTPLREEDHDSQPK